MENTIMSHAKMFVDDNELLKFINEQRKNGLSQKAAWELYEEIRREYGATENRFKSIQSFNMWKSRITREAKG